MTLMEGDAPPSAAPAAGPLASLRAALQPVVALDGSVVGHEALLRTVVDERVRSAGSLLEDARGSQQGPWIDAVAVRLGLQAWKQHADPGTSLFLNAPPMRELEVADWLSGLALVAHEVGVPLDRVVVELHEHQPATQLRVLRRALESGRALGMRFALDDVDVSSRCLSLVRSLAPEVVKLDGAVVRDIRHRRVAAAVSRLVMTCAPRRAVVVAEQVELPEQVDRLVPLGVRHFQGWLVGLPSVDAPPRTTGWRWAQRSA